MLLPTASRSVQPFLQRLPVCPTHTDRQTDTQTTLCATSVATARFDALRAGDAAYKIRLDSIQPDPTQPNSWVDSVRGVGGVHRGSGAGSFPVGVQGQNPLRNLGDFVPKKRMHIEHFWTKNWARLTLNNIS